MSQHRFACWVLVITVGHLLVGTTLFWPEWVFIIGSGWINAGGPDQPIAAVAI